MMEKNKKSFRKTITNLLTQNHATKKAKDSFLIDINEREQLFIQAESVLIFPQAHSEASRERFEETGLALEKEEH